MDIRLMGTVEIRYGDAAIPLPRAGERCVLACLALEPNRRVHVDTLIDRLWGDDPPAGGGPTIASYLRTVRKAIEDAGGRRDWLRNYRPATYQLTISPSLVDYHRFTALVAQARRVQRDGDPGGAVTLYRKALVLRRAEALGSLTGQWAANRRYAIEQEYLDTVCALYEQQLAVGDFPAVATHATQLVMEVVPTDRMIALAIHALAYSGQHAAITSFLTRATHRMWDTAQAQPSPKILALASQLMANPDAGRDSPSILFAERALPDPDDDETTEAGGPADPSIVADAAPAADDVVRGSAISMTAEHNQRVYQAARDQHITGA